MKRFPSKDDYLRAVQRPDSFTSKGLRRAEFVLHPVWQIPAPAAGSSAVVFRAVVDGQDQALRFPTRADTSTKLRYDALHEHFAGSSLARIVAMPRWHEDAISVDGRTWPMVQMDWINGRAMHQHVERLVDAGDTGALGNLARNWLDLVTRLQAAHFAHGDLQHGNVLVDDNDTLRLVDFDCSWVERFAGQPPPTETGHRNYQPENRPWGRWMDTFSGLVVYLSLLALSKNPTPWRALNTGDNLLFRREDFRPPFQTPAWAHLAAVHDPELDQLAARLQQCCRPNWIATGGLLELLAPAERPWWENVSPTSATVPPRPPARPRPEPPLRPPSMRPAAPHPAPVPSGDWWQRVSSNAPSGPQTPGPENRRTGNPLVAAVLVMAVLMAFLVLAVLAIVVR